MASSNIGLGQAGTLAKQSSHYSLAGYLELLLTKLLRTSHRRYWFWFDEMTCSLKYYRNQETYSEAMNEPVGTIDLSYAKVTPLISNSNSNIFIINVSGHVYKLCAKTSNDALSWVEKLQEKRGEYMKACDIRKKSTSEQERGKKTLRPFCDNQAGLVHHTSREPSPQVSPPSVRKIINSRIGGGGRGSLNFETGVFSAPADVTLRRSTIDTATHPPNGSPTLHLESPLESPTGDLDPASLGYVDVWADEAYDGPASSSALSPQSRQVLELRSQLLKQQKELADLQRENLRLLGLVQTRDASIHDLNMELSKAREHIAEIKKPQSELRSEIVSLKNIIEQYKRSLQSFDKEIELHKQSKTVHMKEINAEKQRVLEMERDLNLIKSKYVKLLNMQFKIRIPSLHRGNDEEDPELVQHTDELLALTAQEGGDQQNYRGSFEDDLGDIHDWQNDVLTQRYLCRLLYLHYKQTEVDAMSREWEDHISQLKRRKSYLEILPSGDRSKKRELRALLRKGIPMQYRKMVWTGLVFRLVGRVKETRDAASEHNSYYWSLVNSTVKSGSEKQIKIDLHRTLPNNKYFKLDGAGIPKLESVLLAFSRHDRNIGYCQSMNMIAALGLLFLDEETAFWLLVAVIEKLLPPNYYSVDLAGVQADQKVMSGLMVEKLPRLSNHLENYGIDIALITLNWFLTLFIDAMPTKSALRVMDCFLLEGVKFLFRASLSVLGLYQQSILQLHDQVALLQYCKEVPKHIFDIETLFQEIGKFAPFPTSSTIQSRHQHHLVKINEQLAHKSKRSRKRAEENKKQASVSAFTSSLIVSEIPPVSPVIVQRLVWECGCVCTVSPGQEEVWLCGGDGKLGVVSYADGRQNLNIHNAEMSPRVICAQYVASEDLVLVGTLDLHLIGLDYSTKRVRWDHLLNDSVLSIAVTKKGVVFVSLADGFLAVLQDLSPDCVPVLIRIGSTAVSSMILVGGEKQHLWCGCGKAITILCTELLEPTESLVMSEGRVNKLVCDGDMGVWVSYRSSSHLTLYHASLYVPLLSMDYLSILPPQLQNPDLDKEIFKSRFRITSLMLWQDHLWVGTGGGRVLIFSYRQNPEVTMETALKVLVQKRKEVRETSLQNLESQEGGLLGNSMTTKVKDSGVESKRRGTESESKKEAAEPFHKRQKTRFGRTLRNNKALKQSKSKEQPDLYSLTLEKCSDHLTGPNDSVRILLPLQCGPSDTLAVSCVNPVKTYWQKGVQLWTCPRDSSATEWHYNYLNM